MTLIERARKRFPPGTIFSNENIGCGCSEIEVTGINFWEDLDGVLIDKDSVKNIGHFTVYSKEFNKWAEVTNKANIIHEVW